jgi:putative N6-adenine-specific DNA methylase
MQETLAAAMLALSRWQGERPLVDPMCGSGTLLCEALMAYCRIPAGYLRQHFGCRYLPDYDAGLWRAMKADADAGIRPLPAGLISGGDADPGAVAAASVNCRGLPGGENIRLQRRDCLTLEGLPDHVIVSNPPYGVRLTAAGDLKGFYRRLGDFLKKRCPGASAFLFFGERDMIKHIGLKPSWKKALKNAALDGRAARFDLFRGYRNPDRGAAAAARTR